ncbi:MAG TPA: hypothetical protein VKA60_23490 [Blastocatellia bacterium]|nr:hypothetical protein [Blastocatellia bacterium]
MKTTHRGRRPADASGGRLPSIPMSKELAESLSQEAALNMRSPRDHALRILEHYFWLGVYPNDKLAHQDFWKRGKLYEDGPRARSQAKPKNKPTTDEVSKALDDIARLSEDEQAGQVGGDA